MAERTCVECGNALTGRQTKVCSERCRNARLSKSDAMKRARAQWRRRNPEADRRHPATCVVCGTEWLARRRTATLCSDVCRSSWYRRTGRRPVKPGRSPRPERWKLARQRLTRARKGHGGFGHKLYVSTDGTVHLKRPWSKESSKIPRSVRLAVYERDGWTCQLCGEPVDRAAHYLDPLSPTLDHIECRAWVLVPDHRPENLRLAHRICNSLRGDERHAA